MDSAFTNILKGGRASHRFEITGTVSRSARVPLSGIDSGFAHYHREICLLRAVLAHIVILKTYAWQKLAGAKSAQNEESMGTQKAGGYLSPDAGVIPWI